MRVGYETNDEEKRKNKLKPVSVKEPTPHTRLLHHNNRIIDRNIATAPTSDINIRFPKIRGIIIIVILSLFRRCGP